MDEVIPERVAALREHWGMSQARLGSLMRVSQASVNRIESGESRKPRNLLALARALRTTTAYLTGESNDPFSSDLPAFDEQSPSTTALGSDLVSLPEIDLRYGMGASYVDLPVTTELRQFSRAWLSNFTRASPEHLFWATGDGDSMQPTIRSGETVLIDRSQKIPRVSGGIWALTIGGLGMIKRLHVPGKGRIQWLSDCGFEPPIEPTEDDEQMIIGRVIAVMRRL